MLANLSPLPGFEECRAGATNTTAFMRHCDFLVSAIFVMASFQNPSRNLALAQPLAYPTFPTFQLQVRRIIPDIYRAAYSPKKP